MKNRMRTERTGRGFLPALLLAAVLLFQPAAGLTVRAQEQPQTAAGTQTAEIQTDNFSQAAQTDISAQNAQEAAAAAQAQADALMAAHLAAWQQAKEEYAAQLAAYQQALAAQQAAAVSQTETAARQQAETAQAAVQQTEEAQTAAQQQTGIAAQTDAAAASQTGTAAQAAGALSQAVPASWFAGKTVSILGDSISTFQGWIPEGYACFYPDPDNDIKDVSQTWWMQVIQNTGMRLLVNGSWSASTVCGDSRAENSGAGCSSNRIVDLMGNTGTVPDVILVYMGINDFFHSIDLGSFSGTAAYRNDHYIWDFTEGYELMLQKLQAVYPTSRIYCMTLLESNSWEGTSVNANGNTVEDYNSRIRQVAAAHGVSVIDLRNCGIASYELGWHTSDGVHPNRKGAAKIAAYVTNALLMGG